MSVPAMHTPIISTEIRDAYMHEQFVESHVLWPIHWNEKLNSSMVPYVAYHQATEDATVTIPDECVFVLESRSSNMHVTAAKFPFLGKRVFLPNDPRPETVWNKLITPVPHTSICTEYGTFHTFEHIGTPESWIPDGKSVVDTWVPTKMVYGHITDVARVGKIVRYGGEAVVVRQNLEEQQNLFAFGAYPSIAHPHVSVRSSADVGFIYELTLTYPGRVRQTFEIEDEDLHTAFALLLSEDPQTTYQEQKEYVVDVAAEAFTYRPDLPEKLLYELFYDFENVTRVREALRLNVNCPPKLRTIATVTG